MPFALTGAPRRLYVLDYGLFKVHANGRVIGISGYLIETDAGERVLIDSGFPAKYAEDPHRASREDRLDEFGTVLTCTPDNLPTAQLARIGLSPGDIDLFVLTHTHIDHLGGIADFAGVPMVISAAERALPRPLYWGEVQPLDWPDRDYRVIAGDAALGPGFELLQAPGHAPGQLAILLDLPKTGAVLLTSDAISRPEEVSERFAGAWDPVAGVGSADRLLALADRCGAFVVYGHWPRQWPALLKAPDFYD